VFPKWRFYRVVQRRFRGCIHLKASIVVNSAREAIDVQWLKPESTNIDGCFCVAEGQHNF